MRPGVVGMMPADPRELNSGIARKVRAAGFTGVTWMITDPLDATEPEMRRVREILEAEGVRVAQANARYERLIHPERNRRRAGIRALRQACTCARWLNAGTVYVRPGSLNPRGHWWPHPLNTHPETFDRLVSSLREVVPAAEEEGVLLALEGHVLSPLDTPERILEAIQAVESPALRFNADPTNMIGTLPHLFHSGKFIDSLFDLLGDLTVCAHVKDVTVEDRFVLHISECIPGEGMLDLERLLRRFEAACPDGYAMIEHLTLPNIPKAKKGLDVAMERAGLTWRE